MYDRDYLMRLISQMSVAMGRLMGLKEQKKHDEAMELIDEFLSRELRMRTRLALGLSDEDLLKMLSIGSAPNLESVAIIAAFLQEDGDLLRETGRTVDAVPRYEKALRLLIYAILEGGPIKGLRMEERVRELIAGLEPYETTSETKRSIWGWEESQGQYADAENRLYELYEDRAVTADEGRSFYKRLERLEDDALERGGLPRGELREGLEQWIKLAGETAS
ncbi:DUF6483 domain-containing protein [Cohnella lubricantis]|uniref:Tetratricopeptide repeat protein n=1 Tax=Cohnella lubricantis TaxID=2163172 RepID=A0A841TAF6_9BACL|nr:DUF6483 family protein [Cohnella lubricantis]MBB6677972.1 hypothetical protein [Cohnella lubricantis]MBP2119960.1 hypothetical protein [Cohnella lubricantis]